MGEVGDLSKVSDAIDHTVASETSRVTDHMWASSLGPHRCANLIFYGGGEVEASLRLFGEAAE